MPKILVTPRSVTKNGHPALDKLKKAGFEVVLSTPGQSPSEEELLAKLPDCVGYLAGVEKISLKVLDSAKNLKVIGRNGTGIDNVDLEAAKRNNIQVRRAEGANARGVAELAFGQIIALIRSIPFSDSAMKKEAWERRQGIELEGRTLGIVGCGVIGKLVTKFALGFDMKVIAFDPYPTAGFNPSQNFSFGTMDEVLTKSDIISLHCPPLSQGQAFVNKETIAKMKKGVYIVNTARGGLLNLDDVLAALDAGHIAGVAVDAFVQEPPEDWRLVKHSKVISTPHIGGFTVESVDRAVSVAVDNILDALK